jgi:16S rRNA G966 N2-methylase RsmD
VGFLRSAASELKAPIQTVKSEVFSFLKSAHGSYDLIFADPPYDLPNIPEIHQWVFDRNLLNTSAWLIIEHGPRTNLSALAGFKDQRKYGNVNFSFFQRNA